LFIFPDQNGSKKIGFLKPEETKILPEVKNSDKKTGQLDCLLYQRSIVKN